MPVLDDITASSIHADDPQKQMEAVVKQVNDGFRAISNEARTNITKDDAGDQRLLIGYQENGFEDGNVGVKLSQSGIDVGSATNSQLIFSTDFNLFKIVGSGTTSLSYDGVVTTFATIPHNLGTIPIVLAYVQFPNDANFSPMGGQYVPMPVYLNRAGLPFTQCVQSADATNVYLRVHDIYATVPAPEVYNFRYYLLQETAN